jgi:hypothetical protein
MVMKAPKPLREKKTSPLSGFAPEVVHIPEVIVTESTNQSYLDQNLLFLLDLKVY